MIAMPSIFAGMHMHVITEENDAFSTEVISQIDSLIARILALLNFEFVGDKSVSGVRFDVIELIVFRGFLVLRP